MMFSLIMLKYFHKKHKKSLLLKKITNRIKLSPPPSILDGTFGFVTAINPLLIFLILRSAEKRKTREVESTREPCLCLPASGRSAPCSL